MPEVSKVKTRIILPADTVFDFAGDGLTGAKGQLRVDAGAGFTFNEWGRLILNLLENGGLGYINDKLCINACEVASRLAGTGLRVNDCKLAVDFSDIAASGRKVTKGGKLEVDVEALAGRGLKVVDVELVVNVDSLAGTGLVSDGDKLNVDLELVAAAAHQAVEADMTVDPTKTTTLPYTIDTNFRYKPNGYGYNCGLEVIKTFSTLTLLRNHLGRIVGIEEGELHTDVLEFDFGCNPPVAVAERAETPAAPNFSAN